MSDADLVARAQAGDTAAFGDLIARYAGQVRRIGRTILRHPEDADDAAQDAFFAAWRALDRFDPSRPFGPWMMRIAVNAAQDLRRRRRVRQTEPLLDDRPSGGAGPDREADRVMLKARLDRALGALSERHRLVVVLFDAEGFSHAEIAELLGVPAGTVRSDLFHARRALRQALGPLAGDESR